MKKILLILLICIGLKSYTYGTPSSLITLLNIYSDSTKLVLTNKEVSMTINNYDFMDYKIKEIYNIYLKQDTLFIKEKLLDLQGILYSDVNIISKKKINKILATYVLDYYTNSGKLKLAGFLNREITITKEYNINLKKYFFGLDEVEIKSLCIKGFDDQVLKNKLQKAGVKFKSKKEFFEKVYLDDKKIIIDIYLENNTKRTFYYFPVRGFDN